MQALYSKRNKVKSFALKVMFYDFSPAQSDPYFEAPMGKAHLDPSKTKIPIN